MGAIIQFPAVRTGAAVLCAEPATVIVLPVIRVEHVSLDIEKLRQAAKRFNRKRKARVVP
jgi:hypothetical protein